MCIVFASLFSPADHWDVQSTVPHLEAFANLQKSAARASATCFPFYFMDLSSLCRSWSLVWVNSWCKGTGPDETEMISSLVGWKELGELHLHYMCLPEKTLHVLIKTFDPNET